MFLKNKTEAEKRRFCLNMVNIIRAGSLLTAWVSAVYIFIDWYFGFAKFQLIVPMSALVLSLILALFSHMVRSEFPDKTDHLD